MSISTPSFKPAFTARRDNPSPGYSSERRERLFVSRWHMGLRDEEKRQCPRRDLRCPIALIDNVMEADHKPQTVSAECMNISDDGLYAIVPIGYGVVMGQRYTFRLITGERGPEPGLNQIVMQQGRIVRTELLLGENGQTDRVGIGVKLIGPRSGMIPMPLMGY